MSRVRRDTETPVEDTPKPSNGLKWWVSPPPYVKPSDDEICGEPLGDGSGFCQKTVREHRAEFLAFGRGLPNEWSSCERGNADALTVARHERVAPARLTVGDVA